MFNFWKSRREKKQIKFAHLVAKIVREQLGAEVLQHGYLTARIFGKTYINKTAVAAEFKSIGWTENEINEILEK